MYNPRRLSARLLKSLSDGEDGGLDRSRFSQSMSRGQVSQRIGKRREENIERMLRMNEGNLSEGVE